MIIAAVAAVGMLFGAGGFSFDALYKPYVKQVVVEEQRQDEIMDVFEQADKDLEDFRKNHAEDWVDNMQAKVTSYDTTRDEFVALRNQAMQAREEALSKLLDVRFKVVSLMTEDEWNAMFEAAEADAKKKKDE